MVQLLEVSWELLSFLLLIHVAIEEEGLSWMIDSVAILARVSSFLVLAK